MCLYWRFILSPAERLSCKLVRALPVLFHSPNSYRVENSQNQHNSKSTKNCKRWNKWKIVNHYFTINWRLSCQRQGLITFRLALKAIRTIGVESLQVYFVSRPRMLFSVVSDNRTKIKLKRRMKSSFLVTTATIQFSSIAKLAVACRQITEQKLSIKNAAKNYCFGNFPFVYLHIKKFSFLHE